jgi:hypothetical protein
MKEWFKKLSENFRKWRTDRGRDYIILEDGKPVMEPNTDHIYYVSRWGATNIVRADIREGTKVRVFKRVDVVKVKIS